MLEIKEWPNGRAERKGQTEWPNGIQIGEKRGEQRGEKKKQIEIAKKLKSEGISVDIILKTTGLSVEELEEL